MVNLRLVDIAVESSLSGIHGLRAMALLEGPLFYVNGKIARGVSHSDLSLNEYIRQHTPYKVRLSGAGREAVLASTCKMQRCAVSTQWLDLRNAQSCQTFLAVQKCLSVLEI